MKNRKHTYLLFFFIIALQFIGHRVKAQDLKKADSFYNKEEYAKAAIEYEKVLPAIKEQYGKNDTSVYAPTIFRAASSLDEISDFAKSEKYFEEGVNIYRSLENGTEDFWFILFANQLAFNYDAQAEGYEKEKDYFKAEQYYLKSLKFVDETFGKVNYGYPETCKKLAGLYIKTKNYTKAEALFNEALKIDKTLHGKNDWRFAESYRNISVIFKEKGEYKKAKAFYEKAVRINKNPDNEEDSLGYATSCIRLASLYHDFGNFSEAELFFVEAKKIRAKVLGTKTLEYSESCNKLARLYLDLGNYTKAEQLFIESKNIREKAVGKNHPLYAQACNNLGALYVSMGDMERARKLYFEAYEIRRKTVGSNSKDYAISCNNLASIFIYEENYPKAEEFLIEAKNIIKKLEPQSTFYIHICNHLATLYELMEQYDKAKLLYLEAKSLQEKILGKNNPGYLEICNNLARVYETEKDDKNTEIYYGKANKLLIYLLNESSKYMSEKEREKYLHEKIDPNFEINYSYYLKRNNKENTTGLVYNNTLNIKGQLLKSTIALRKAILQSGDTVLIEKYKQMNRYGKMLAGQYTLPIDKRRTDIKQLEEKRNKAEKELTRIASKRGNYVKLSLSGANWKNIQKSLKEDEAAIEFVSFKYAGLKYWTDSVFYYALILRKNYTYPEAVFLFEEKQLQNLLARQENENDFMYVKRLYSPKSAQSDRLYGLIFKPLEAQLKNIKSVHLSPTGLLNKIAFDALVSDTSVILSDKYNILYSSTTASAANKTGLYPKDIKNVVLFGGIEYDLTPEQMLVNAKTIEQSLQSDNMRKDFNSIDSISRNVSWAYLEGSKLETEKIDQLVADKNVMVKLYSGEQGSEEQFKALENAEPSVIHVSTHGFYFGNDKKSKEYIDLIDEQVKFAHSKNPLLRSGFILAGGNAAFQGKTMPNGVEDGVLTAAEISQMNLFDTKLVVLSACQTGLGDVKGNEGVYGLQRAFKMAGVEYLLFSLWEVPDYQTRELMSDFYENWFSGMEVRVAFKKAQNQLKAKYAKVEGSAFAWAAFVLMK